MAKNPIYDFLPAGRENAVSRKQIGKVFGLTDRETQKQIEAERARGAAILSDTTPPGGYFKAANMDELAAFTRSMLNRFESMSQTIGTAIDELEKRNREANDDEV